MFRWIGEKVDQRLRNSQLRIIYQNYKSVQFNRDFFSPMVELGDPSAREIAQLLEDIQFFTVDAILGLAWKTTLDEKSSHLLVTANEHLKRFYADIQNANAAINRMGGTAPSLPDFTDRFQPPGGWTKFRESDWDEMLAWATELARRESSTL